MIDIKFNEELKTFQVKIRIPGLENPKWITLETGEVYYNVKVVEQNHLQINEQKELKFPNIISKTHKDKEPEKQITKTISIEPIQWVDISKPILDYVFIKPEETTNYFTANSFKIPIKKFPTCTPNQLIIISKYNTEKKDKKILKIGNFNQESPTFFTHISDYYKIKNSLQDHELFLVEFTNYKKASIGKTKLHFKNTNMCMLEKKQTNQILFNTALNEAIEIRKAKFFSDPIFQGSKQELTEKRLEELLAMRESMT